MTVVAAAVAAAVAEKAGWKRGSYWKKGGSYRRAEVGNWLNYRNAVPDLEAVENSLG
jgi:hypothetical protein